jgi:acetolactate synthase-1/2/3 large subunit
MNVQEMETARRLNSKLVALVWEDKAYGLIEWKQEAEFGQHTDLAFENPDWLGLAAAFAWNGHHVTRAEDFAGVLRAALDEDGPSLVVAPVDYRENMILTERLGEIVSPGLSGG